MKKYLFAFISFLIFSAIYLLDLPVLTWLELKSVDWRFAWRGPIPSTGELVIVAIDEKSLNQEGRWPWSREKIAAMIRKINQSDPKMIEMDVLFAERTENDAPLVEALQEKGNVILGYFFFQNQKELEAADISAQEMEEDFQSILPTAFPEITGLKERLPPMAGIVANTPEIAKASPLQGFFNAFPDPDGVLRRFPLMVNYRNKIFPAISLETFSQHEEGFDPVPVKAEDGTLVGMSVGSRLIPTNNQGEMIINYRGTEEQFKILSATDILQDKIDRAEFKGKTVLVGATAVGIYDLRVTPVSPILPGVFVQANLVDNLYRGDFLRASSWTRFAALIAMLVISIILAWSLPRLKIVLGLLIIGSVMTLYLFFVQWVFGKGLLFPLVTPTFQWLFISLSITIQRGVHEERQKRNIRRIFRSYLHPDIVEELIHDPEKLKLGGQRVECTIFFSDVRNFTDASEKMAPETVVQLMNEYFDPVSKEIIHYGGYIDKFLGDGIMAIFGAPKKTDDHPFLACQASLEVLKKVRELEPLLKEKFGLPNFRIGIGLHTGPVILGNIGTAERLNYTVMGDSVNLAARLQGANKELGTTILISQKTYERVADKVSARYIDTIRVKGKEEAIPVYEVLDLKGTM